MKCLDKQFDMHCRGDDEYYPYESDESDDTSEEPELELTKYERNHTHLF